MFSTLNKEDCKLLEPMTAKTTKFSLNGYKTFAKCVHAYDGDTIHVVFKMPNSNDCSIKMYKMYKFVTLHTFSFFKIFIILHFF